MRFSFIIIKYGFYQKLYYILRKALFQNIWRSVRHNEVTPWKY